MIFRSQKKGFALVEVIVSIGVFLLFASAIFAGIQYVFKSVYFSRLRIIETAVLNEQLEIIRNIPYENVGILNGSPPGVLDHIVTTTRNGIDFTITRTIRNVDDGFDGTVDGEAPLNKSAVCHDDHTLWIGTPAVPAHVAHGDTEGVCEGEEGSPGFDIYAADYKLAEVSIICDACGQQNPVIMSTLVAPKFLEGNPDNGALRIEVYENGFASVVQGATVHVVATTTNPTFDFYDTTNNNGQLLLVDLPEGTNAYHITVTKDGYTTDMTTTVVPNPLRPPASVIAQDLQTISFEINPASSIAISTIDSACVPVAYTDVSVSGERLIGTDPDSYEVDETITTNGNGLYTLSDLSPDDYDFFVPSYDIIGAIPISPLTVAPGTEYSLSLLLGPNQSDSLLVNVIDSINKQPIADAAIHVTGPASYDETAITGIGHIDQGDWSGGSGQTEFILDDAYYADDGNIDGVSLPGDITLMKSGPTFVSSGWIESSMFDLGTAVNFSSIDWQPFVQPSAVGASGVRFQIATSNTSTPASWEYKGPDGTAGTYYDEYDVEIHTVHDGDQYLRYKVYLQTVDTSETPTLSNMTISYSTSCTPPGQAYFGSVESDDYDVDITASGYQPYSTVVTVNADTYFLAELVPDT